MANAATNNNMKRDQPEQISTISRDQDSMALELYEALHHGDFRKVAAVLKARPAVSLRDSEGRSPLDIAISLGHPVKVIRSLAQYGFRITVPDQFRESALCVVLQQDRLAVLMEIHKFTPGVVTMPVSWFDPERALAYAIKYKSYRCARWLIANGAPLYPVDDQDVPPMQNALRSVPGMRLLVAAGFDPEKSCSSPRSFDIVAAAASEGNLQTLNYALSLCHPISPERLKTAFYSALERSRRMAFACVHAGLEVRLPEAMLLKDSKTVNKLLASGNCTQSELNASISFAARDGSVALVRRLLKMGAHPDGPQVGDEPICTNPGFTIGAAAALAAQRYWAYDTSMPHLHVLIAAGANINAGGERGTTALHEIAKRHGIVDEYVANQLIALGANVNARDEFGLTPLMIAVGYMSVKQIDLLLKAGAEIDTTDAYGRTAIDIARIQARFDTRDADTYLRIARKLVRRRRVRAGGSPTRLKPYNYRKGKSPVFVLIYD